MTNFQSRRQVVDEQGVTWVVKEVDRDGEGVRPLLPHARESALVFTSAHGDVVVVPWSLAQPDPRRMDAEALLAVLAESEP